MNVLDPDGIDVAIPDLNFADLLALLDGPASKMESILNATWRDLSGTRHIAVSQLINACRERTENESTAEGLRWRIQKALDTELFAPASTRSPTEYVTLGQITVL